MSARVLSAVIGVVLMAASRSPVSVTVGHATVHVPVPVIAAGLVFGACAVLTLLIVRALRGFGSCPHMRTAGS